MISKEEIQVLLHSTENFRVERTVSTTNMDKFCEAICAFSNDLPDSRQKGYLMMNACMHRDYQSNMPIRLYQFDDHIEIMNAGGLYGEARPENFPNVNDYRNPIIAEAMKEMKYVNMFNQGIRRVQDMLLDNGNKEAVFDVSKLTAFEVTVPSTVDVTQDVTQGVTQGDTQSDTQGDTQGDALDIWIEEQIRRNPKITTEELAKISKKGLATIKRHIAKLAHIKYVGSGYSGHWEIIEDDAEM